MKKKDDMARQGKMIIFASVVTFQGKYISIVRNDVRNQRYEVVRGRG